MSVGAALVALVVVAILGVVILIGAQRLLGRVHASGHECWGDARRLLAERIGRRGGEEMKRNMNGMRISVVLWCLVAIGLAGCATARGVGQDTQSLGRSIEKKAQ